MRNWLRIGAAFAVCAAVGCGKADTAPDQPAGGMIKGKVTFADGKPIDTPGTEISIAVYGVSDKSGEKITVVPTVKPDGTYAEKLLPGKYRISSMPSVKVKFDGQYADLSLEPVGNAWNRDRDAADGIVQDFVWKTTGLKPDQDGNVNNATQWYGESITVNLSTYRNDTREILSKLPDGTKITFSLKPTGPDIAGKPVTPQTIERTYKANELTPLDSLNDLPIADYDLTATAKLPDGGSKTALFQTEFKKYEPRQQIRFKTLGSAVGLEFPPAQATFICP